MCYQGIENYFFRGQSLRKFLFLIHRLQLQMSDLIHLLILYTTYYYLQHIRLRTWEIGDGNMDTTY